METYPQQFEAWRPDYPQVWNILIPTNNGVGLIRDINKPMKGILRADNFISFYDARKEIIKMMELQ